MSILILALSKEKRFNWFTKVQFQAEIRRQNRYDTITNPGWNAGFEQRFTRGTFMTPVQNRIFRSIPWPWPPYSIRSPNLLTRGELIGHWHDERLHLVADVYERSMKLRRKEAISPK